jgi:hypothetical protein
MFTSKQLYDAYSAMPCKEDNSFYPNPLHGNGSYGAGTPHYMRRVVQFMKHLVYPCIDNAPGMTAGSEDSIVNTGSGNIALPFKLLQQLDSECFVEKQPTILSGTSHAIRNACDISRSCMFIASGLTHKWQHRMATEYLEHYGSNSLADCLMVLGPNLVTETTAYYDRAPNIQSMSCLPTEADYQGATGATWTCMVPPGEPQLPKCRSCDYCPDPPDYNNPCCNPSDVVAYKNLCCKAPLSVRPDFGYLISSKYDQDSLDIRPKQFFTFADVDSLDIAIKGQWGSNSIGLPYNDILKYNNILDELTLNDALIFNTDNIYIYRYTQYGSRNSKAYEKYSYKMRHAGILPRAVYGGYANFLDNSGSNFYGIVDDLFLDHIQSHSGFFTAEEDDTSDTKIYRAKTISMLSPNVDHAANSIKDLLWNGYGIVLFSNIGFPNSRDSQGISYPDRIWYNTYSIIGYDDTKTEFDECVYVLSCPWGKWTSGGDPSWGPLPDGCFLVTETHLKCMLEVYADRDYYNCRSRLPCNPAIYDCDDSDVIAELSGCGGHGPENKCEPYFCAAQQRAMGLAFAISLTTGFTKQKLDHFSYLPIRVYKEQFEEKTLYFRY